jgi:dTDP-4-dehydrorhamnose 3,5-epimerase
MDTSSGADEEFGRDGVSIRLEPLRIKDAYGVVGHAIGDARGCFSKPFTRSEMASIGFDFRLEEIFWSLSRNGTIRGMHFQAPPHSSKKLVWCLSGVVTDVILDLRRSSPTHGECVSAELGEGGYLGIIIPEGCAHGFEAARGDAIVSYATSAPYAPDADLGVRWDSIGHLWEVRDPLLSERDQAFPRLVDFETPF